MIFVTVGTDQPFDRLIKIVDNWAEKNGRSDVFAQIGDGGNKPSYIKFATFLEPPEFQKYFSSASIVIGHAGMGTILSALHHGKPIVVMPRKASWGEQRNEHQLATARYMSKMGKINVAFTDEELTLILDHLDELIPRENIGRFAATQLISRIKDFIAGINENSQHLIR
jgi:UDP-N-acetylglucosamine transferase subunit ALG13